MDSSFIHYNSEMRVKEAENALEAELYKEFSVDCTVELLWGMETESVGKSATMELIKIKQIYVTLTGKQDEEVVKRMRVYLSENYCSEVLIE